MPRNARVIAGRNLAELREGVCVYIRKRAPGEGTEEEVEKGLELKEGKWKGREGEMRKG